MMTDLSPQFGVIYLSKLWFSLSSLTVQPNAVVRSSWAGTVIHSLSDARIGGETIMATVKLDLGKLAKAGYSSADSIRIIQALESANIQVNLQIKGQESMKLLGQIPALQKHHAVQARFGMLGLLMVGILASLATVTYGVLGLLH